MNIQQLRQSLKQKWLSYYEENSSWLVKMRVWATYDGLRRPSSGFILATLSVLEPQFEEILDFILELSNNPDKIVAALGLNFNPDEELRLIKSTTQVKSESLEDKLSHENKGIPLVLNTTSNTLHSDLPRLEQSVTSFTDSTEVDLTQKGGTLVAVITKIPANTSVKALHSVKPDSGLFREDKPVKSPVDRFSSTGTLAIAQVNSKAKTMPSVASGSQVSSHSKPVRTLPITTEISSNNKPVRSLAITTEVPKNTQHVNTPPQDVKTKVNLLLSTNARSVASWVDEFCQGTRCDREELRTQESEFSINSSPTL
ncbi:MULTISPECIES: DUF5331 domain-containing protein [Nostoc]|uniref:DUF5331 domain-containing protein n=1 Tax=Nostoc paludosum FACHB-159 TaxID=2692908 RepID=A0ABR8KIQ9_9NOSO|nr:MULTISPECIES: DUF5331 domain-containing protein [Nostoc]MBD2682371.1 hypothetical protein [Nostoc sp. FACHB-857]MBD2738686.1 hypothetical protein [Nostoc paludosum FACHB-159]